MPVFTRQDLENKIKEIFGITELTHLIDAQITKFVNKNGFTFLEIGRALAYHFVILDNEVKPEYGIGIVPYVMNDARKYFEQQAAMVQSQILQAQKIKEEGRNYDIICKNKLKKTERPKPFIDISSIKEDDNG